MGQVMGNGKQKAGVGQFQQSYQLSNTAAISINDITDTSNMSNMSNMSNTGNMSNMSNNGTISNTGNTPLRMFAP